MTLDISIHLASRLVRVVAIAGVCTAAGTAPVAIADDPAGPQGHTVAGGPGSRYFDIEANKAAGMRALGLRIAEERTESGTRYRDLEANKARSQRVR